MPPFIDIYVVTERKLAVVDCFLSKYADLSIDSQRTDYEVQLTDTWEFIETGTLTATLAFGLADTGRKFALYFTGNQGSHLNHPTIYFGLQGHLLLGLSIDGNSIEGLTNDAEADMVLAQLKTEYNTEKGLIGYEFPPADADEKLTNESL